MMRRSAVSHPLFCLFMARPCTYACCPSLSLRLRGIRPTPIHCCSIWPTTAPEISSRGRTGLERASHNAAPVAGLLRTTMRKSTWPRPIPQRASLGHSFSSTEAAVDSAQRHTPPRITGLADNVKPPLPSISHVVVIQKSKVSPVNRLGQNTLHRSRSLSAVPRPQQLPLLLAHYVRHLPTDSNIRHHCLRPLNPGSLPG